LRPYWGFCQTIQTKGQGIEGKRCKPYKNKSRRSHKTDYAMEESADKQYDLEEGEKKDKMEGDRLKGEEMRRTAMETMGKTQKRKSEEEQSRAKKCRRSGSETVEFLKIKVEQDMDVKKQELDLRRRSKSRWLKHKISKGICSNK